MPTLSFAQGVGYSGTTDVAIRESNPNSAPAEGLGLFVDSNSGAQAQALLAFAGLFGNGPGQIPIGATITSATLTLRVTDATATGVSLSRMLIDWPESSSWNSLGSGVQLDGIEATSSADLAIADVPIGFQGFDVTASLQAWLAGAATADEANDANNGWVFTALGIDPLTFRSSESVGVPVLSVEYTIDGLSFAGSVVLDEGTSASDTPFVFTVNRTGDTSGSASVDWAVTGTGSEPANVSDFAGNALPSGTINFAPGQLSQTITVNVNADSTDEEDETFNVTLSNASGTQITNGTGTGTITNDDEAGLAFDGPVSQAEGTSPSDTAFVFTVNRSGETSGSASVDWAVTGLGAAPATADDFAGNLLPSGTIDFAPGQSSQTIIVNVDADSTGEVDEAFNVTLSNAAGALISDGTGTGTIVNDDASLAFAGPISQTEGTSATDTPFVFTVNRSGDTSGSASVDWAVTGTGSEPANAADFDGGGLPSGTINFTPGQLSQTITVNVNADSTVEVDETFNVNLSNATGAQITGGTGAGTIINDDQTSLAFAGPVSQAEGTSALNTPFVFTVNRSGDTSGTASVDWAVTGTGGTAATAADFAGNALPGGTINFAAGQLSQTITVNVAADSTVELDEAFNVTLSNATGALISGGTSTGTITNDDASLAFAGPVSQAEGTSASNTPFVFTVNRGGNTSGSASVNWTVTGTGGAPANAGDFAGNTLPGGTINFAPGQLSQTITVNVAADSTVEVDETFNVSLSNATGAQITGGTGTGTITNDDASGGGGGGTATFQQGVNYFGTIDVTIRQATPNSAPGGALTLFTDGDSGAQVQALLAFTDLFGTGFGQIPIGATVTSATLTLSVTDASTSSVSMSRMLIDWSELSSWNSLGSGVQLGVEATGTVAISSSATGLHTYNVTDSLQAWLTGATTAAQANAANDGWVFTMSGTDQWAVRSSESGVVPVLTVEYTTAGGGAPQLGFAGPVSKAEGTGGPATPFVFTVNRSGDTSGSASVNWAVTGTGGTPATAADFAGNAFPSGTINFAAGQQSRTITVNVVADSTNESNETFNVTLSNPTGAQISGGTALGTIVNDDVSGGVLGVIVHDGTTFGPGVGSTDPTDVAYDPSTGFLFVCDSEVDESPFNSQNNLFKLQADGDPQQAYSMRNYTSEPTGVVIWQDRLYVCDDNRKMIFVVDKNNPTVLLPGQSFSTTSLGIGDPEDLSVNPNNGNLFVLNELNKTIYEIDITPSGPVVVDTILLPSPFPISSTGAEGLVYDAQNDQFYVCAGFSANIYVVNRAGVITSTITILTQFPNDGGYRVYPKGLELAPASDGSGNLSLWVTDYGRDQVADGRILEIVLDRPALTSAATTTSTLSLDSFEAELKVNSAFHPTLVFDEQSLPQLDSGPADHLLMWQNADLGGDIWLA